MALRLAGWLLVIGILLFVFPEPVTSGLGILVVLIGVGVWLVQEVF